MNDKPINTALLRAALNAYREQLDRDIDSIARQNTPAQSRALVVSTLTGIKEEIYRELEKLFAIDTSTDRIQRFQHQQNQCRQRYLSTQR
jgi:hypothetical protein